MTETSENASDESMLWLRAIERTLCSHSRGAVRRITLSVYNTRECKHERCDAALDVLDAVMLENNNGLGSLAFRSAVSNAKNLPNLYPL